jgi:hypothetical protein
VDLMPFVAPSVTLLAILAALFKEDIVKRWRKPDLRASMHLEAPDCELCTMQRIAQTGDGTETIVSAPCYAFRMRIENCGREKAEHVQVFVAEASIKDASGAFRPIHGFLPLNLEWSYSAQKGPDAFADVINPGMTRYLDFGHIIKPEMNEPFGHTGAHLSPGRAIFTFFAGATPQSGAHLMKEGSHRLKLYLSASNADRKTATVDLMISGAWHEDAAVMLRDGIAIKVRA